MITAIVRTRNSDKTLQECLQSLANQSEKIAQIIVVDNSSMDRTLEIAKKFNCTIVDYPKNKNFNYSKSLNIGIANASSNPESLILIVSSHVILNNTDTVKNMKMLLLSDELCAGVSVLPSFSRDKNSTLNYKKYHKNNIDTYNIFNNPCSMMRKSDWLIMPFNEQIPFCEDQAWAKYFLYKKNKFVYHIHSPTVEYKNPYLNSTTNFRCESFLHWCVFTHLLTLRAVISKIKPVIKNLLMLRLKDFFWHLRLFSIYCFTGCYYRLKYGKIVP